MVTVIVDRSKLSFRIWNIYCLRKVLWLGAQPALKASRVPTPKVGEVEDIVRGVAKESQVVVVSMQIH